MLLFPETLCVLQKKQKSRANIFLDALQVIYSTFTLWEEHYVRLNFS